MNTEGSETSPGFISRPRGMPTGGRARGKCPQKTQQEQQPAPVGPTAAAGSTAAAGPTVAPLHKSAYTMQRRGRAPPQLQKPVSPLAQVTKQLEKMDLAAGDASVTGGPPAAFPRGGSEPSRGSVRQRSVEETHVFRSTGLETKQGLKGQKVQLQANYFKFIKTTNVALYQYRVDFQPDIDVTHVRKAILRHHKDIFGAAYIFDGTVLYTTHRLQEGLELTSRNCRDDSIVRILIKLTTDLQIGDPHYVTFLNQILRGCLGKMDLELVNRDYYDPRLKIDLPQHKLEIWPGFLTSIRQHETDLLLNCDLSSKVLRHESALSLLKTCRDRMGDTKSWQNAFEEAIIGSIVITNYNNRTYMIDDVDWNSTPSSIFDMKGRKISYKDYFREKYQIIIVCDDQPVLVSKPKLKDIRGGKDKIICLIPEISYLTGLDDSMRANYNLMKAIADNTKVSPNIRIQKLEEGFMKRLISTKRSKEELQLWNMSFDPNLISFPGRVLPAENIILAHDSKIVADAKTGDFTRSLVNKRASLLDTGNLTSWAVIYPRKLGREVQEFCQNIAKAAGTFGMRMPEPKYEVISDDRAASYVNAIETLCNSSNLMMIMTILLNNKADRYEAIKKKCYVQRPIPNQVVLAKNVNKNVLSIATKIAIQMCCKIGGSPWTVSIPFKVHTMVVGFDVCHDARLKGLSVGALVASLNKNYTRYYSSVNFHKNGAELSAYLPTEMMKAVVHYSKVNDGAVPERIFFYRDGVGEGNLHYVLENEAAGIRDQWHATYNTECPITFTVVSKRINTRIFLQNGNPLPGTVVDSTITLPTMYDFFLVSQSVNQGTVSPTSYNVIYDNQNIKPDIIQQLSYKLTHLYFNWSGTVRVPAPCQYAHKLAFLVGQHIHTAPTGMNDILYFL